MDTLELNEVNCKPGMPLRGYTISYSRKDIETYLSETGEQINRYIHEETCAVPLGLILATYGKLIHETFQYQTGVHVSSAAKSFAVLRENEEASIDGEIERLFDKNGDKYVSFDITISRNDDLIATINHTSIYQLRAR